MLNNFPLRWKKLVRSAIEVSSRYRPEHREALSILRLARSSRPHFVEPTLHHVSTAVTWMKRAQDSSDTGGVAWGYRTRRAFRSNVPLGWMRPYPETTGYIIPTMLRYAAVSGDSDCIDRARRMTDWEVRIQLPDGGFQGGTFGAQPVESSTFVTGQVLFGLTAAYQLFGDDAYRLAAVRAGDYLLSCLDGSGRFVKGYCKFCVAGPKAYEARTGLALAEL